MLDLDYYPLTISQYSNGINMELFSINLTRSAIEPSKMKVYSFLTSFNSTGVNPLYPQATVCFIDIFPTSLQLRADRNEHRVAITRIRFTILIVYNGYIR